MTPNHLYVTAMVFYILGTMLAYAAIRYESLRKSRWQLLTLLLGMSAHSAGIGLYCTQSLSHFFTSISDVLTLFSWALGVGYLIVLTAWSMRSLGSLLLPLMVFLLALSQGLTTMGTIPANNLGHHPLFALHIICAFLGYGLYLTAAAASVIYLKQGKHLKQKVFSGAFQGLPSLAKLEKAETVCVWVGLLLFTVAVGTGAKMAKEAGMENWYFEPKILATWSTWLIFLVLGVGRLFHLMAGRVTAKIILVGGIFILITFLIRHPFRLSNKTPSKPDSISMKSDTGMRKNPYHQIAFKALNS